MATSTDRNSKPDTVFLCLPAAAGAAASAIDVSQSRTNISNQTTYCRELNSTRTGLISPREISIVVDLNNTDSATLAEHGQGANNANFTWRVRVSAGTVTIAENNVNRLLNVALPGVGAGNEKFLIHWSGRTEGAQVRSELYLRNLTDGSESLTFVTHSPPTTNATYGLYINGGATAPKLAAMTRYHAVRIGRRFHSVAEGFEDWVTQTTPPAMSQLRRAAAIVPDRPTLGIGNDGDFAGPAHLWAGYAFDQADRRLVGALVNLDVHDPAPITHAYAAPNTAWWRTAPGDTAVHLCISLLWYRPVPGKCNRARVRLFVRQTCTAASVTAEVRYRLYSVSDLPVIGEPVKQPKYYRTAQAVCSVDHDVNADPGEWLDLGDLALAVDGWSCTWLAVGVSMDEGSPFVAGTVATVLAVTIDPFYEPPGDGPLDSWEL